MEIDEEEIDDAEDYIPVKPDLLLPAALAVSTSATFTGGIDVGVTVEYDEVKRRYVMIEAVFRRDLDEGGLTAHELRQVGIWDAVEEALPALVKVNDRPAMLSVPINGKAVDTSSHDGLVVAARKYALSRAMGHAPLRDLADWLGVSHSTAKRVAAKARAKGLLDG